MTTSEKNGNKIIFDNKSNEWKYEDGKSIKKTRKCPKCKKKPNKSGIDACLVKLPGIINACCGHGKDGYIQFENGTEIRFNLIDIYHNKEFNKH